MFKTRLANLLLMGILFVYRFQVFSLVTYSHILFPSEVTEKNEH